MWDLFEITIRDFFDVDIEKESMWKTILIVILRLIIFFIVLILIIWTVIELNKA